MSMFKDIPVEVGVIYEGERIRRNDMQIELGGPTVKAKFELAKVKPMNEIEDGKITIIGPDIKDMKEPTPPARFPLSPQVGWGRGSNLWKN